VNPFIELMQAGALIMLLFAAVLISVVIRNTSGSKRGLRIGPAIVGVALILFAIPIYASVIGTDDLNRFTAAARVAGAVLLPIGLYLLGAREEGLTTTSSVAERATPEPSDDQE
jgi:hypothetical protein